MNKPMTCQYCMYRIPCATKEGLQSVCLNADSGRIFEAVEEDDTCEAWYTEDFLEEVEG